jgi:cell division transport system ATP-binding protein
MASGTDNSPIVQFSHVSTGYLDQNVLTGVDLSIAKGEFVYLIGKTGSGKSSILKMIYADLKPRIGTVRIAGQDLTKISRKQIPFLRRKLGIVFQDFQLLPDRSVYENIRFALRATGWTDNAKITNRVNEVLMKVGLSHKMKSMPHQLSGGEQQRVTIARALINDPVLILADEPTGNLDPEATQNIMEILFRINLAGTAVLMATHEHDLIRTYPARTLECRDGALHDLKMTFS